MKDRSDSNLSLCEKLMGHSVTIPLDNHYAPFSKEKLFEEFRKAIPELTVSDVERKQTLIESQKKEITELSKKEDKIQELTDKISAMERADAKSEELVKKMPAMIEKLIEAKLKIQEQRHEKERLEKEYEQSV